MSDQRPLLVVGVGASAGGLEAFKSLLSALPGDTGMAFLLVQHLDPTHDSLLTELLDPATPMEVREADQNLTLRGDTVYTIQPGTALAVRDARIRLSEPELHRGVRLPVNHLFRSLAEEYGARSVGIVLSGAGSDGSAGLRAIKSAGGLAIAQDPETCGQPGMPRSAIDTGVVDLVLEISDIPGALDRFAHLAPEKGILPMAGDEREPVPRVEEDGRGLGADRLATLAPILEAHLDFDLGIYKSGTVGRRVLRRIVLAGFDDFDDYVDHLRGDETEQRALVRDLLIGVTDFFRDPDSFRVLREMVLDPMVARTEPGDTLRVWVPGCATGEEAYSLGIEILETIRGRGEQISLQMFATDVDQEALALARRAEYPPSIAERVEEGRLGRYFQLLDGKGFRVRPQLRDLVSFAAHDLTKDAPFSRMHLVSCRNVLIYLRKEAQRHVLEVLHFALRSDGCLFLSSSESTGNQNDLFTTLSKKWRIYRKSGTSRPMSVLRSRQKARGALRREDESDEPEEESGGGRKEGRDLARRAVLRARVAPTVIVSAEGSVEFFHGELGPFLRFPEGDDPQLDFSTLIRPELATRTRSALYRCRRNEETVVADSSPDMRSERVRITASPAPDLGDGTVILTFEELGDSGLSEGDPESSPGTSEEEAVIEQLERELRATREDLRSTVEELETSNEELRSSNEESMSMNEELQSANEELEATTEELRSLNEELTTVNAQLREKIEQVEEAHDALRNFFASTRVATIFLDEELRIARLTPAAEKLLEIDHGDIGRFFGDISRELFREGLEEEARSVLERLVPETREIRLSDGRWFERRILPYRTESRRIVGVVVTFNDVTELRSANQELEESNRRLELAWEVARGGIYEHAVPPDKTTYFSDQWAQILGFREDELPPWDRILDWVSDRTHPDDREKLEEAYEAFVTGSSPTYDVEVRLRHRGGHWIWARGVSKAIERDGDGSVRRLIGMILDTTDRKRAEEALRESETRFRTLADNITQLAWMARGDGSVFWFNRRWLEYTGRTLEEMEDWGWTDLHHPDHVDRVVRGYRRSLEEGREWEDTFPLRSEEGDYRWFLSRAVPIRDEDGRLVRWFGTSTDVTDQRLAEERLREADRRKDEFLAMLGHELRNPLGSIRSATELLRRLDDSGATEERALGVLERQSDHMSKLLDGLLDVSRVTQGKFRIEREPVELREILQHVLEDRSAEAVEAGITLRSDLGDEALHLAGDPQRLSQVFHNLVGNGLKFTGSGGRLEVVASREGNEAIVRVRDTGSGFDPESAELLFEPFRQGPQDLARESGGLGLGLAVARGLVDLHDGRIEARSDGEGKGAEILVRLPLSPTVDRPTHGSTGISPGRGLRLLLVEDDEDSAVMLKEVLELEGHRVDLAADGRTGLEKAREEEFDVVLCDLGLPGDLTGFDVAERIRSDENLRSLGLVALSGYGRPEDKARCDEVGFDAHLTKPVDVDAIGSVLEQAAGERDRET